MVTFVSGSAKSTAIFDKPRLLISKIRSILTQPRRRQKFFELHVETLRHDFSRFAPIPRKILSTPSRDDVPPTKKIVLFLSIQSANSRANDREIFLRS